MTDDPMAIELAAGVLERAARAASALEGDDAAARLLLYAVRQSARRLAAERAALGAIPETEQPRPPAWDDDLEAVLAELASEPGHPEA